MLYFWSLISLLERNKEAKQKDFAGMTKKTYVLWNEQFAVSYR